MPTQTVLITGAARGIGAGIARCFADTGANVVVTDLDGPGAEAVADDLPVDAVGLLADAASQVAMAEACAAAVDRFGSLDVLVNNAGIGGPDLGELGEAADPDAAMSDEVWDQQVRINLRTAYSSSMAAAAHLTDGGSIVNIASIAALQATPQLIAYGAAKAGVVQLTRSLAKQFAAQRIRVNCICPGLLWTRAWEMLVARMQADSPELAALQPRQVFEAVVADMTPLGGEQTPEDIGHLAVFLASGGARMITGQVVAVDGGITLG